MQPVQMLRKHSPNATSPSFRANPCCSFSSGRGLKYAEEYFWTDSTNSLPAKTQPVLGTYNLCLAKSSSQGCLIYACMRSLPHLQFRIRENLLLTWMEVTKLSHVSLSFHSLLPILSWYSSLWRGQGSCNESGGFNFPFLSHSGPSWWPPKLFNTQIWSGLPSDPV